MIDQFQAAQNGDRAALEIIWAQYEDRLSSFVKSRLARDLRQVVDVDDVLQETFVRAMDSIGMMQWQGEYSLFSWFCGIALNVIRRVAAGYMRLSQPAVDSGRTANSGDRPN